MEGNNNEGKEMKTDGVSESFKLEHSKIGGELQMVGDVLSKAVKSTGLAEGVFFKSVQIISRDKEGEGYGAFFGLMVDLGKIPDLAAISR